MYVAILVLAILANVQTTPAPERVLPAGAAIYVEQMSDGLDGYLRAEMVSKRVPLKIVLRRDQAHYVLTGAIQNHKREWHEGWLSVEKDHTTGSVMVIDRTTGEMIWAGEAGDRTFWGVSRDGARKVASRLAVKLNEIIAPARTLPPPPPLSAEEQALADRKKGA
jgi:hypothetical protein